MDNIGKLRNMTAIYLLQNNRVLLLFRKGSKVADKMWIGAAGGHFEKEELNDAKACILREMKEELGLAEDMLNNLALRYITIRGAKNEIRQNYYFFAELKEDISAEIQSNEGTLQWFELKELADLPMPFSAKFMMEHYVQTGRHNDKIYCGVADGEKVVFTELPEF